MCNDKAIAIVMSYIERYLTEPAKEQSDYEFRVHSYEQWAASDILDKLLDAPFGDPIDILENWALVSEYFRFLASGTPDYVVFDTVYETVLDIKSLFEKENKNV